MENRFVGFQGIAASRKHGGPGEDGCHSGRQMDLVIVGSSFMPRYVVSARRRHRADQRPIAELACCKWRAGILQHRA